MKFFSMLLLLATTSFSAVVGATGGQASTFERVQANDNDQYKKFFFAGLKAGAAISGDGDTDLDLYVYDDNSNLICSSESAGDDESCTWTPRYVGEFTIIVKNRGSVYNDYSIVLY